MAFELRRAVEPIVCLICIPIHILLLLTIALNRKKAPINYSYFKLLFSTTLQDTIYCTCTIAWNIWVESTDAVVTHPVLSATLDAIIFRASTTGEMVALTAIALNRMVQIKFALRAHQRFVFFTLTVGCSATIIITYTLTFKARYDSKKATANAMNPGQQTDKTEIKLAVQGLVMSAQLIIVHLFVLSKHAIPLESRPTWMSTFPVRKLILAANFYTSSFIAFGMSSDLRRHAKRLLLGNRVTVAPKSGTREKSCEIGKKCKSRWDCGGSPTCYCSSYGICLRYSMNETQEKSCEIGKKCKSRWDCGGSPTCYCSSYGICLPP